MKMGDAEGRGPSPVPGTRSTGRDSKIPQLVTHDWKTWPAVKVRLLRLPQNATSRDLYQSFQQYGTISRLEISANLRIGYITFSSAPNEAFWLRPKLLLWLDGHQVEVGAELLRNETKFFAHVVSPVNSNRQFPKKTVLLPSDMAIGFFRTQDSIMEMRKVPQSSTNDLKLVLDLICKEIHLYLPIFLKDPRWDDPSGRFNRLIGLSTEIGKWDRIELHRLHVSLNDKCTIWKKKMSDTTMAIVIHLLVPPRIWKKLAEKQVVDSLDDNPTRWSDADVWRRATNAVYLPSMVDRDAISLRNDLVDVDFGRWTTYVLFFDRNGQSWKTFEAYVDQALGDFNMSVEEFPHQRLILTPREPCKLWDMLDGVEQGDLSENDLSVLEDPQKTVSLPWEVRYQLESCISRGALNEYDISAEFLETLADIADGRRDLDEDMFEYFIHEDMADEERQMAMEFLKDEGHIAKNKATLLLEQLVDPENPTGSNRHDAAHTKQCKQFGTRVWDPMTIFSRYNSGATDGGGNLPAHNAFFRKARITPTRITFELPSVDRSNRVIRQYAQHGDFFLRVQFEDDGDVSRLRSVKGRDNDEIWARAWNGLTNGIEIGDRTFRYLACSSSQIREHSAYMFCPTNGITPDSIRQWMGDFSNIKIPAKYSARLGQCFSQTFAIPVMQRPSLEEIPDIKRNGQVFTDGVGRISKFNAKMVAHVLGVAEVPSAFQIRLGGCKGMVAVWPDVDGTTVQYRPSQKKFDAKIKAIEVIRCSQFTTAHLNRQLIPILECLGVRVEGLIELQQEQIEAYERSQVDRDAALNMLGKYRDPNGVTSIMAQMVQAGFMDSKEPFLCSLLNLWKAWSLKRLKEKANIIVEQGAFLFGVVDEAGVLRGHVDSRVKHMKDPSDAEKEEAKKHDLPEIFLQIPETNDSRKYRIHTGLCIVGRNPSLHPGDIRMVVAADKPELHHLRDVVVFPSTGDRSIPSMCSGGDLDGDDYFVIWDERLIPNEWNYAPMECRGPKPVEKSEVKEKHLIQFFVQHMKNDSLGTIALSHVAQADECMMQFGTGVKHQRCRRSRNPPCQAGLSECDANRG